LLVVPYYHERGVARTRGEKDERNHSLLAPKGTITPSSIYCPYTPVLHEIPAMSAQPNMVFPPEIMQLIVEQHVSDRVDDCK
jgi:hypothetical protein